MAYDNISGVFVTLSIYAVIAFVISSMFSIVKELRAKYPKEDIFGTLNWILWTIVFLAIIAGILQAIVVYLGSKRWQSIVLAVCFVTAVISGLLIWMAIILGSVDFEEDDLTGQICHFLMLQTIAMATLAFAMIIIAFLQFKDLP